MLKKFGEKDCFQPDEPTFLRRPQEILTNVRNRRSFDAERFTY